MISMHNKGIENLDVNTYPWPDTNVGLANPFQ